MTDLSALIERLEKATGPDREIDAEIFLTLNPTWRAYPRHDLDGQIGWQTPRDGRAFLSKHYTGSIDDALCELPKGWEPHRLAFPQGKGRTFAFEIFPPSGHPQWAKGSICEQGNTAPLAICIASLRARAAS